MNSTRIILGSIDMTKERRKPGPRGHGVLSMAPRAVRWRAQRDRENAAWRRDNGQLMPWDDPETDTERTTREDGIGVFGPPGAEEEAAPTEDIVEIPQYHCSNCSSEASLTRVTPDMAVCPICGKRLEWAGLL